MKVKMHDHNHIKLCKVNRSCCCVIVVLQISVLTTGFFTGISCPELSPSLSIYCFPVFLCMFTTPCCFSHHFLCFCLPLSLHHSSSPGLESSLISSIWKHSWIFSCEIKPPSKPCPGFLIKDLKWLICIFSYSASFAGIIEMAVTRSKTLTSFYRVEKKNVTKKRVSFSLYIKEPRSILLCCL